MTQTRNQATKTRKNKKSQTAPVPKPKTAGSEEVLTLAEAAAYLRVPEQELLGLVGTPDFPARRIGTEWRFLKAALQRWLCGGPKTSSKEAWLAMAGAFQDDPDLESIVEDAYRRRGRPITEDGSYRNFSR